MFLLYYINDGVKEILEGSTLLSIKPRPRPNVPSHELPIKGTARDEDEEIVSNDEEDDASQAGDDNAALLASNAATQASNGDSNALQAGNAAGKKNKPDTWNKSELANRMKIPILWLSIFNDHIPPSRPYPRKVIL